MQEAYKRILERRLSQLVEQVHWTKEFSSGLERHGLVSRDELKDIEMELNHKNRVYGAVTRIMSRDRPGTFDLFRQLLLETGGATMAESLEFDRQRIQWEFEKPSKTTSLVQYIDGIVTELIQKSISEPEPDIRQRMMLEVQRRLNELRNSLRQQQLDRDEFRSSVMQILGASFRPSTSAAQNTSHHVTTMTSSMYTLSELENIECRKDQSLIDEVRSTVERLRRLAHRPQEGSKLEGEHNESAVHQSSSYESFEPQCDQANDDDDDDVVWNSKLADTCHRDFNNNNDNNDGNCVRIEQAEYNKLVDLLKPFSSARRHHSSSSVFSRRNSPQTSSSSSLSSMYASVSIGMSSLEDDVSGPSSETSSTEMSSLYDMTKSALYELERWKRRACRLSTELRRLEAAEEKDEDEPPSRYERAIMSGTTVGGIDRPTASTDADLVSKTASSTLASNRTRRVSLPMGYMVKSSPALPQLGDESTSGQHHRSVTMATQSTTTSGTVTPTSEAPLLRRRRMTQHQHPVYFQAPIATTTTTTTMKATSAASDRSRKLSVTGQHPVLRTVVT